MILLPHRLNLFLAAGLAASFLQACGDPGATPGGSSSAGRERAPAPVEVARIERRDVTLRRAFSGALEASAEVRIAARVAGHVEELTVDGSAGAQALISTKDGVHLMRVVIDGPRITQASAYSFYRVTPESEAMSAMRRFVSSVKRVAPAEGEKSAMR